ncbi:MAG TPA: hypothetical protein VJI52_06120 [Candidatus Nanoarchaeia archaeon]|nr:hypothetical protein [Candidatus Nanoarchaeia archaeon]
MSKQKYILAFLVILVLFVSSCAGKSGASTGSAPRTPFIGGTAGITINFEKDNPPPEVTDDDTFGFRAIIDLKNEGEYSVPRNDIKVNLVGFDPADFGKSFDDLRDVMPDDNLDSKRRDAEGNILEGTTTYAQFPRSGDDFIPTKFPGNTPFTFRADVCYNYQTQADAQLCILKDMINIRQGGICIPTQGRVIYSSSAPVQVVNFRQSVIGKDKLSFTFDVVLSGNVDVFWSKEKRKPATFDSGCPRNPTERRAVENNVGVTITEIPADPLFSDLKCGGLDGGSTGVVRMINGRRTITCTASIVQDRLDLEKGVGILLEYNVLDNKETQVLIKHLATNS